MPFYPEILQLRVALKKTGREAHKCLLPCQLTTALFMKKKIIMCDNGKTKNIVY